MTKRLEQPPDPHLPGDEVLVLDLDRTGSLIHPELGRPVAELDLPSVLGAYVELPAGTTDIVLFVHGWRTRPDTAAANARRLRGLVHDRLARSRALYPELPDPLVVFCVALRWKSMTGYWRGRARAHDAGSLGHAALVVAHLLNRLDEQREQPSRDELLQTSAGQYLHCVGHSFGGRFLCQAVQGAGPDEDDDLLYGPVREHPQDTGTVDSLLLLQMAAKPGCFKAKGSFRARGRFAKLLTDAPVRGPVALTHSRHDRATGLWHLLAEGRRGIGTTGVRTAARPVRHITLRPANSPYPEDELREVVLDIDASEVFRDRGWPQGAHSDYWHPESGHLLLSLMDHAREAES